MPPLKHDGKSRNIRDFFKPFTIPKERIPVNDVVEEEIVLAPARRSIAEQASPTTKPAPSPSEGDAHHRHSLPLQGSPSSSTLTVTSSSSVELAPPPSEDLQPALPHEEDATCDMTTAPGPTSSQRRTLAVVEVPSPRLRQPDPSADKPTNITKISFSSISSLTSVPRSTQSSSRRIVRNGMHAVTNSDSGSAESSSSSSSSDEGLQDMSTFVPRKRPKLDAAVKHSNAVGNSSNAAEPYIRQTMRSSRNSKRSSGLSTPQREATPPRPVYRHSLLSMARQKENEEKVEMKLRQMEAEFEETERQREEQTSKDNEGARGRRAALVDDSDEGERMNLAMQRTEAKSDETELFFFQGVRDGPAHAVFPPEAFGDAAHSWARRLQDEKWRIQACLTGFLGELVAEHGLSQPLGDWIAYQLLHEAREDLCEAYVSLMEVGLHVESSDDSRNLSFNDFYVLHRPGAVRVRPGDQSPGSMRQQPRALSHIVRVLRYSAVLAGDHAIGPLVLDLMYAAIDATVRSSTSLHNVIFETIEYLLDSAQDEERLFIEVCTTFTASQLCMELKCRAITSLPGCSERSHALRRRLALEFISPDQLSSPLKSTRHVDGILEQLRSAFEFQISESTDYILLNSLISVLDIAIDAGFTEHAPYSNGLVQAPPPRKGGFSSEGTRPVSGEENAENAFNRQIDSFVDQLTLMSSRIKDAGTAHLHRTEAKHAIERLAKRLEYGVRTKPRPRKKTFGGVTGEIQRSFLNGFLTQAGVEIPAITTDEGHALDVQSAAPPESEEADVVDGATEEVPHHIE